MNESETTNGISVVVCTYDDPKEFYEACFRSLVTQQMIKEIIVIDSSRSNYIKNYCINNNKFLYHFTPPKGLSDARNKGINIANYNIIAFTDPDCIADENWAKNIFNSFTLDIAIVGGKVLPRWMIKPNKIFLNSAISQGFFSLFDMGNKVKDVDQIFGGNFAINRSITRNQLFSTGLGRKKEMLLSGEESDLCMRLKKRKLRIIFSPSVIIWHNIPKNRLKFKWMWKRVFYAGITRAKLGGKITPKSVSMSYNIFDLIFFILFFIPYFHGLILGYINWNE